MRREDKRAMKDIIREQLEGVKEEFVGRGGGGRRLVKYGEAVEILTIYAATGSYQETGEVVGRGATTVRRLVHRYPEVVEQARQAVVPRVVADLQDVITRMTSSTKFISEEKIAEAGIRDQAVTFAVFTDKLERMYKVMDGRGAGGGERLSRKEKEVVERILRDIRGSGEGVEVEDAAWEPVGESGEMVEVRRPGLKSGLRLQIDEDEELGEILGGLGGEEVVGDESES